MPGMTNPSRWKTCWSWSISTAALTRPSSANTCKAAMRKGYTSIRSPSRDSSSSSKASTRSTNARPGTPPALSRSSAGANGKTPTKSGRNTWASCSSSATTKTANSRPPSGAHSSRKRRKKRSRGSGETGPEAVARTESGRCPLLERSESPKPAARPIGPGSPRTCRPHDGPTLWRSTGRRASMRHRTRRPRPTQPGMQIGVVFGRRSSSTGRVNVPSAPPVRSSS